MTADTADKRVRAALITTLAALALRRPLGLLLHALLPGMGEDPALYYAAVILQEALLWGLPAVPLLRRRTLRLCKTVLPVAGMAFLLGMAAQTALTGLTAWWSGVVGGEGSELVMPQNAPQTVLAVLALTIVPALAEEAFFRGGLQAALTGRLSTLGAWAATTVIFALMHGSLAGLPSYLIVSALCGLLMVASGSVWPGVLFHLSYNGMALVMAMNRWQSGTTAMLLCGLSLCLGAAVLPGRAAWQSGRGLTRTDWALLAAVLAVTALGVLPAMM